MNANDARPVSVDWLKVEAAVAAFEDAHRRNGRAAVADHCPPADDPLHLPVVCELIRADLEFAWASGVPRMVDDYRADFPALFADPDALRQVAFEEYRLRIQSDEHTSPSEYVRRFGIDVSGWASQKPPGTTPEIILPLTDLVDSEGGPRFSRIRKSGVNGNAARPTAGPTADRFPEPGETYLGFRVVRELGRGAFARVYLAEQDELAGRLVALKVSAQLADESQTLARLQHTNIVPIYSTHRAGRFQAVCMPYFGRTTLADVLQEFRDRPSLPASGEGFVSTVNQRKADPTVTADEPGGADDPPVEAPQANTPLDQMRRLSHEDAALWVAAELADGLAHAHDRGVLHRDLKPANVLLADDGRPMLLDFNLASTGRGEQVVGGTPYYMAPEQLAALAGEPGTVDARSDVYSLGLVLYELLTGRPPADPPTGTPRERMARLRAERSAPPPPPRRFNPAVSRAASAVVAKCLAPAPADRYPSAHHLRDDLRRQLADQPLLHVREPSFRERAAKFARRNPWVKSSAFLGSALAAVLAVAAAVVFGLIAQRDAANRAVAERQFRDELADHRVSLVGPVDDRRRALTVDRARQTLSRFGLPGGDGSVTPTYRLDLDRSPHLRPEVASLHLLAAGAEPGRDTPDGRRRVADWLSRAESLADEPTDRRVRRLRGLLDGSAQPGDDPADGVLDLLARREFRRLLAVFDDRPATDLRPFEWKAKAQCHMAVGQFAEAVACYTTALALHGKPHFDLLAGRGRARLELKRHDRAVADFDAALDLEPDAAEVLIDRALARLGQGRHSDAVADLDRAFDLWPTHTRILFIRAEAKARGGDKTGAAKDRDLGLTAEPGDEDSAVSRGVARLNAGDANGAIADFDAALRFNPNSRDARQNKAAALADHLNRAAEAVDVLDKLIADYPDFLPARGGRGVYLARLGKRDAAHADAAEVLKRDPPPFFRYQVAGVYALTSKTHPADADDAIWLLASAFQDRVGLEYVGNDPDLGPLGKVTGFRKLVEAARELAGRDRRK